MIALVQTEVFETRHGTQLRQYFKHSEIPQFVSQTGQGSGKPASPKCSDKLNFFKIIFVYKTKVAVNWSEDYSQ